MNTGRISWWKWLLCLLTALLIITVYYSLFSSLASYADKTIIRLFFCACGVLGLFVIYKRLFFAFENRSIDELRINVKALLEGACLSFTLFFLYVCVCLLFGKGTISLNGITLKQLFDSIILLSLVAVGEEFLFRGVVFRLFMNQCGFAIAILVSSLLFGFSHALNPSSSLWSSIAISLGMGVLLALLYKKHNSLWGPITFHFGWNLAEGNILGTPVSGLDPSHSVFLLNVSQDGFFAKDGFGPESSPLMICLCLAISILYCFRIFKSK